MGETNIEKAYVLRELQSKDVFIMSRIISKIGIKEFKSCFETEEVQKLIAEGTDAAASVERIGLSVMVDIAGVVLSNVTHAEQDIYSLLADLSGKTVKDIAELDMVVFAEMIIDVVQKDQFKDFIKVVSKLFK